MRAITFVPGSRSCLSHGSRRGRGFTLIELLVVISIIAVLIALLLPAVQQAREAARRTQCRNNMHQIGLALHNYHDAHSCLPPGVVGSPDPAVPADQKLGHTWLTQILPFMDQMPYYNAYDFELRYLGPTLGNTTVMSQDMACYVCPSSNLLGVKPRGWGATTYAGCVGYERFLDDRETTTGGKALAGAFNLHHGNLAGPVQLRDIRDGTSNTLVVSEVLVDIRGWAEGRQERATNTGFVRTARAGLNGGANVNRPPGTSDGGWDVRRRGFSSRHEGVVLILLADGSVRPVSENVDTGAFAALATMAGNEQIDDEDF